jgi:hypothetical protein
MCNPRIRFRTRELLSCVALFAVAFSAYCRAFMFTERVYRVSDIAGDPQDLGGLVDLIKQYASPNTWDTVGGPGYITRLDGSLTLRICTDGLGHRRAASLLRQIRQRGVDAVVADLGPFATQCTWDTDSP